jgi:hypothetical protein
MVVQRERKKNREGQYPMCAREINRDADFLKLRSFLI